MIDSTGITGFSDLGPTMISTVAIISELEAKVAVIVALPSPFAVTVPLDTVAMEVAELVQVTAEALVTVKA